MERKYIVKQYMQGNTEPTCTEFPFEEGNYETARRKAWGLYGDLLKDPNTRRVEMAIWKAPREVMLDCAEGEDLG